MTRRPYHTRRVENTAGSLIDGCTLGYAWDMTNTGSINQTLLTLLENQTKRTHAAFEAFDESLWAKQPGGDCNTICDISRHLVALRQMQLELLDSPLAEQTPDPNTIEAPRELLTVLERTGEMLAEAINGHDEDDWYTTPDQPRSGPWGEMPTIMRFVRPFNDYVNHLGAIRAIRRIHGNPAPRTQ